jgi:hypothetical protein
MKKIDKKTNKEIDKETKKKIEKQIEDIRAVRNLAALGYTEAEIAYEHFQVTPETFSRWKAENPAIKEAIAIGKFAPGFKAQETLEYIMEYGTVEKNRVTAAIQLYNRYVRLQSSLEAPTSIQINFAKPTQIKTKEEIEKDVQDLIDNEFKE